MAVPNEYGKALFMLSLEENVLDRVRCDLVLVDTVLRKNPEYLKLLDTPAIAKAAKISAVDEAFSSVYYSVRNVLKILSEKHEAYSFSSVAAFYYDMYDEHNGIEHVEAVTAIAMTQPQKTALTTKLEKMTGKRIVLENKVDPGILGGVVLRYCAKQIDGSVKARLDAFAQTLNKLTI